MSELFSSIKIEAYLSGSWVDLTPDVRAEPAPKVSGMGIMGNHINERVGDVGKFTFTLDNSIGNSAATNGYYTPGATSVRSGWRAGVPVRLYFEYDSIRSYKFYGYIDTDGIKVTPGIYGKRDVRVTASNWMKYAAEQKMSLLYRQINYDIFNAVQDILDHVERKPLNVYWWGRGLGGIKFPTVFDVLGSDTKAVAEFERLAVSELGYIYVTGDQTGGETLIVENQANARRLFTDDPDAPTMGSVIPVKSSEITDYILLEDNTNLLLEDGTNFLMDTSQRASFTASDIRAMTVNYGKNLANKIKFKIYPRTVDSSAVVLATLEEPIFIEAGETLTDIRHNYKDPNNQATEVSGFNMLAPVATTDYQMFANEDGTGTDYTANLAVTAEYGAGEVKYSTLVSSAGANAYITKLDARGQGTYIYDTIDKIYENSTSITNFGAFPLDMNMVYLADINDLWLYAEKSTTIWSGLLQGYNLQELTVDSITFDVSRSSKLMMAFMTLEAGKGVLKITEAMSAPDPASGSDYNGGWWINGYDFEIIAGKYVRWTCCLKFTSRT